MQINRLLEIVYILLRKELVTAKELAERFEVSQRTIYRDVDALSLAGIPVYTEKGKGGGISLLPEFVLNKSILSEKEQNDILSALKGLSVVNATETDQVLNKLSSIFNKSAANWLEVDFTDWGYNKEDLFNLFKKAILEHLEVEFDYYSTHGDMTSRRIEPIQLWFKSKAWYIKGFCLIRQDFRTFKLSRIKNLVITDRHFSERGLISREHEGDYENISETAISKDGMENPRPVTEDVNLIVRIAPEMAYRIFDDFSDDMAEKQSDGSYIVSITMPEDEWLYNYLLSYGEYIEIIEPIHMQKIIQEQAKKIFEKYL